MVDEPSGFQSSLRVHDELAVEHAVNLGLAGREIFLRAFRGVEGELRD